MQVPIESRPMENRSWPESSVVSDVWYSLAGANPFLMMVHERVMDSGG